MSVFLCWDSLLIHLYISLSDYLFRSWCPMFRSVCPMCVAVVVPDVCARRCGRSCAWCVYARCCARCCARCWARCCARKCVPDHVPEDWFHVPEDAFYALVFWFVFDISGKMHPFMICFKTPTGTSKHMIGHMFGHMIGHTILHSNGHPNRYIWHTHRAHETHLRAHETDLRAHGRARIRHNIGHTLGTTSGTHKWHKIGDHIGFGDWKQVWDLLASRHSIGCSWMNCFPKALKVTNMKLTNQMFGHGLWSRIAV